MTFTYALHMRVSFSLDFWDDIAETIDEVVSVNALQEDAAPLDAPDDDMADRAEVSIRSGFSMNRRYRKEERMQI